MLDFEIDSEKTEELLGEIQRNFDPSTRIGLQIKHKHFKMSLPLLKLFLLLIQVYNIFILN